MQISTFMSVQKLRLAGSVLRTQAQAICVFRVRNKLELDAIIEELSAVYTKEQLMEMYDLATREPFSFWYIYLSAKRKEDMFFLRFDKRLTPALSAPSGKGVIDDHGSLAASTAASAPGTQPRL